MTKLNFSNLHHLFTDEKEAFRFAVDYGLIADEMNCPRCQNQMKIIKDSNERYGQRFRCGKCGKSLAITYSTIFYQSKLPINKILHLIYCWSLLYSHKQAVHESNLDKNTVTYYYNVFRSAAETYVMDREIELIGGINQVVEIDETQVSRRKNHTGRVLDTVWVFGGICRQTNKAFAYIVKDRTADSLIPIILDNIAPGTHIMSDCWKAYEKIPRGLYIYTNVNHSKNFVNPENGTHTQKIERFWRELKAQKKAQNGWKKGSLQSHICEFIWRYERIRNDLNRAFKEALKLLSSINFNVE